MNFNNTEIAFAYRSTKELRNAYLLFKSLQIPGAVKVGKAVLLLAKTLKFPVKRLLRSTLYGHFCADETLEESLPTVERLMNYGVTSILDLSIEGQKEEGAFIRNLELLQDNIIFSSKHMGLYFTVIKITSLGNSENMIGYKKGSEFDEEQQAIYERAESLGQIAFERNINLLVDAEESWIQDFIDEVVERMMLKFNKERAIIGQTVQLYRKDRLNYLKSLIEYAEEKDVFAGAKIVRGAYMEKERARAQRNSYESPIQETKEDSDKDYNIAIDVCLDNIDRMSLMLATHNEESCQILVSKMEEKWIAKTHPNIWFSQLYGMSDHLSFNLAAEGFQVAKYIPYGPVMEVVPYLIRRAEENSSAQSQSGRELDLIKDELKRRKKANN